MLTYTRAEGKMNTKRLSVYTDDLDGVEKSETSSRSEQLV